MSSSPEKRDSVVFLHPQRRYTPAKDLQITFLRSSDLLPTTRDWIGLFRVGWRSSRDYYILSENQSALSDVTGITRLYLIHIMGITPYATPLHIIYGHTHGPTHIRQT